MKIPVKITVGGKRFEDMSIAEQELYREKITDAQRNNVETRVSKMIAERKPKEEIYKYLGLNH